MQYGKELDHLSVVMCLFVCLLVWVMLGSKNSFLGILKHCLWYFVQLKCALKLILSFESFRWVLSRSCKWNIEMLEKNPASNEQKCFSTPFH